jgi:transcriptional regulator with XRE-family HTH domain
VWDVRGLAKKYQITTAVQLQAFIAEKLGVIVSVQTLRAVMRVSPAGPRVEMIQLLCDAFNCRSDAFYVLNPNPARAQQWVKDRSEGKKPSTLYQPKAAEPLNEIVEAQEEIVQGESTGKTTSLRATFTDPRALFKKRVQSNEERM